MKLWKKNNAWSIRRLVDESFIPATYQASVLCCRLSDLKKMIKYQTVSQAECVGSNFWVPWCKSAFDPYFGPNFTLGIKLKKFWKHCLCVDFRHYNKQMSGVQTICMLMYGANVHACRKFNDLSEKQPALRPNQESRREGWTDAAIMLCKLNKSL